VFAAGADDYVSKPIVGPELVTRIFNRLERSRLLRNMAEIDALTGVFNRRKLTQELTRFLRLAGIKVSLCCNYRSRRLQADQRPVRSCGWRSSAVSLWATLAASIPERDVVGRWVGTEFAIGMYGMTRSEGVERSLKYCKPGVREEFTANGTEFQVTFSAGVAQYPQDGVDLQALYRAANAVLDQAKAAGRDRVLPYNRE